MKPAYKPELLPGVFTVNNSGKKVKFAKGNLYWNGSEFRCEEHQYDYLYEWNPNHVGQFFWSKDARVAYSDNYIAANSAYGITPAITDTFFAANGGVFEGFTILSKNEWQYLIDTSPYAGFHSLPGGECVILKPDGFSGEIKESYTATEWAAAESAYGLVALPLVSPRYGTYIEDGGNEFHYWSSVPYADNEEKAWALFFSYDPDEAYSELSERSRNCGFPVRLVSVQ